MGIRQNIFISIMIHTMVIASVFIIGGRISDIACRVPTDYIFVSLLKEVTDVTTTISQNTKKYYMKNTPLHLNSLYQDEMIRDRSYKDEAILVLSLNDNASFNEFTTSRVNEPYDINAVPIGFTQEGSRLSELTKNSFSGEPIQGGDTGGNSLPLEVIRTAIEKAKSYPLLARKKGIEGTVLVRFIINKNGLPQGIQIIRSSGSHILDEEVSKIIKRAAPFPEVAHEIIAPITFKLTEPHTNR